MTLGSLYLEIGKLLQDGLSENTPVAISLANSEGYTSRITGEKIFRGVGLEGDISSVTLGGLTASSPGPGRRFSNPMGHSFPIVYICGHTPQPEKQN